MSLVRALLLLAMCSSALSAITISSSHFRDGRHLVTSALAEARSGQHHTDEAECGETPEVFQKFEFDPCYTCYHHVMYVKGIKKNKDGEEEATDIGSIANDWLHNGLPTTHFYDTEGKLIALLWSTVLSTPMASKEFVIVADCLDMSLYEVEGTGYTEKLGWGVLNLENGTKIDFRSDSWGNEDSVKEEESGVKVIDISTSWGKTTAYLTKRGTKVLPEAAEDSRVFVLLMGTAILRVTNSSPWNFTTTVILPLVLLLCCCGVAIYMGFVSSRRSNYDSVPDSKAMD